ncbi:MAG: phosphoribosylglycinamide formyltransferase [Candidatus Omnitrophica bacterium]|nr:phosphoribosylglycinamide formyltransferase [Candidatus Omnitrophota bacterium]
MKNIAVFCSGNGTNLQAIIDAVKAGKLKVNIALVISDNKEAYALKRAEDAKIKNIFIDPTGFTKKADFEKEIIKNLEPEKIDLIVLAGFMRILSADFVRRFKNTIINIHPALLPAFKGAHAIKDAFLYGVKVTGVSVHFVDEEMDHGPIILQRALEIEDADTLESLEAKIHKIEHQLYPEAIRLFAEGKLKIEGRRVKILS